MQEEHSIQEPQTNIAEIIRSASREERLIRRDEVEATFIKTPNTLEDRDFGEVFTAVMKDQQDLQVINDPEGMEYYYSFNHMSNTYAGILVRKKSSIIQIAETIRENSRLYPRPIPLDLFVDPPFDLQPEDIETALTMMNGRAEFNDIAHTTTSVGTIYLYSTRYLEHDYAQFLAERQDVGLAANP